MKRPCVAFLILVAVMAARLHAATTVYENDFERAVIGKVPEEFLVLHGDFTVKAEGTNYFLELPGAPLDSFGLLLGPAQKEESSMSAKIFGSSQGRRSPVFGVGLNGAKGYTLQVVPAKAAIELARDGSIRKSVPFEWKSGTWTHFYLQVRKTNSDTWHVSGKVWTEGSPEPSAPSIEWDDKEEPNNLRASIWGSPFAGTPIRFDNLRVTSLAR